MLPPSLLTHTHLGTFHATCVRYLRRYASHIGIPNNFTVQDSDDSLKLVKAILPDFADEQNNLEAKLDGRSVLDLIGKAKSKGKTPMMLEREGFVEKSPVTDLVAKVSLTESLLSSGGDRKMKARN